MKIKFWLLSLLVIVAIFANNSCNSSVVLSETEKNEISNTINKMAECWNNGNIDCYMNGYWNSDRLVFIGSSGLVYGWQTVLDRYKGRYPDKATRGELKLEVIKLDKLSNNSIFMIGGWQLLRNAGDLNGYFTTLWKKIDGKWLVVADHSS